MMGAHLKVDTRLHSGGGHEELLRETYLGMAHIAGSGPAGARCRGCEHFQRDRKGWDRKKDAEAYCEYPIHGKRRRLFPGTALACRFFAPVEG